MGIATTSFGSSGSGARVLTPFSAALAGAVLLSLGIARPLDAAQINYGSHMGTHVTYVNVTEDSGAEPLPLFGAPTVTGNSIDFNPVGFDATSANGGSDLTDSNLSFTVAARSGSRIERITFSESGDTTLAGNVAPGSMDTATATFLSGVLDIHEVDFAGINHISVPFSMTFSPSGGTYFLGTDGGGGPLYNTQWTGSVSIPVEDILIANGFTNFGGATRVSVDLDNTLSAVSQTEKPKGGQASFSGNEA
jgi:hypothetical protein